MNLVTQCFAIATSLATIGVIIWMLRRGRLRERHAIWWLVAGFLTLIVAIFPVTLNWTANLLGFSLASNFVYFVSIAVLVLVCVQHSSELTKIESQVRRLAEELALLNVETDNQDTPRRGSSST